MTTTRTDRYGSGTEEQARFLADWQGKPLKALPHSLTCDGFWPIAEDDKVTGVLDGSDDTTGYRIVDNLYAVFAETPLLAILGGLPVDMVLSDGAINWMVADLIDAIRDAKIRDTAEYTTRYTHDRRLQIVLINADGYQNSVASFTEYRE